MEFYLRQFLVFEEIRFSDTQVYNNITYVIEFYSVLYSVVKETFLNLNEVH